MNGLGADQFRGQGGSDIFWFDRPESFGKKHAEKILDFDLSLDVIILGSGRFSGKNEAPDFVSVVGKKDFKRLFSRMLTSFMSLRKVDYFLMPTATILALETAGRLLN